ncbi:13180_t:CDS:2 [Dentiscutata erythropus]|uniref:13180_t:CDS:1 n=1 Tax=Dentiscutata erythropus TaxID=1348616 RepID=A0A9N9JKY6_9GLOM|nr:13180_t:CDS:2 [Dentiscutata erythropus]
MKFIITSSNIKNQLETTKKSIESLKHRLDIYKHNQSEFITSIQRISNEHGIKIQHIEDTLMSTTTMLENFSTSTSAVQTTMRYFNGFEDLEDSNLKHLILNMYMTLNLALRIEKTKKLLKIILDFLLKNLIPKTNEKWNEATITEIAEAYFKTLKKERNTTPAAKLLNDQCARRHKRHDTKSSSRLAILNKIPEDQLNYPKGEIEKLFSFEATSPEVSDIEEASTLDEQGHVPEALRKKLLVPVLPWISDEGNRCHSYTSPMPCEIVEMDDQRWAKMRSLIPAKPKDLPIWAWDQVNEYEYYEQLDDDYEE